MDSKLALMRRTICQLIKNCIDHDVGKNAAALAYYLLFALFPMLIFVSNLLGMLELDVASIMRLLQTVLPRNVVELMEVYLDYVSNNSSPILLSFSLVFTVYFPMRAVKGLMDDVRQAYQLGKPKRPVFYTIRQILFTLVFLLLIILTFLLATLGQKVLSAVIGWFPGLQSLHIPDVMLTLWQYLRFILAAAAMYAALGLLYASAQDQRQPLSAIFPGVAVAMVAWLAVSVGFSYYVENFASYTVIYGTLGGVIVLLSWLYLTSWILILGAEINAALRAAQPWIIRTA